jgi:hypothetical protein
MTVRGHWKAVPGQRKGEASSVSRQSLGNKVVGDRYSMYDERIRENLPERPSSPVCSSVKDTMGRPVRLEPLERIFGGGAGNSFIVDASPCATSELDSACVLSDIGVRLQGKIHRLLEIESNNHGRSRSSPGSSSGRGFRSA